MTSQNKEANTRPKLDSKDIKMELVGTNEYIYKAKRQNNSSI